MAPQKLTKVVMAIKATRGACQAASMAASKGDCKGV